MIKIRLKFLKIFFRALGTILAVGGFFIAPSVNSVAQNVERLGVGLLTLSESQKLIDRKTNSTEKAEIYRLKYQHKFEQINFHPLSAENIWQKAIKIEAVQPVKAMTLSQLATIVSKRHTSSQIWKLENAIVMGDTKGVLNQYDLLISSATTVGPDLAILLSTAAAENSNIRNLLLAFSHRPWFTRVVIAAISQTDGELFKEHISEVTKFLPPNQQQDIFQIYLNQLSEQNNMSAIIKFVQIHRQIPKSIISDFSTNEVTTDKYWGSLAWEIPQSQTTSIYWDKNKKKLYINGKFDISTLILRRTVFLMNENREISIEINVISGSLERIRSLIQCKSNSKEIFVTDFVRGNKNFPRLQQEITLPPNCNIQSFQLYLTSKLDQNLIAELSDFRVSSTEKIGK